MINEEVEKVLDELNKVNVEHLNKEALRLFNAIMSIADQRDLYKHRIDKALAYIKWQEGFELDDVKLMKILKGEENESN